LGESIFWWTTHQLSTWWGLSSNLWRNTTWCIR
jgi:hypothetical protein